MSILKSTQSTRNDMIKMALLNFAVESFDELFKPVSYRCVKKTLKKGKKIVASDGNNLQAMATLGMSIEPFTLEANNPYMLTILQSKGKSWKSARRIYSLLCDWPFYANCKYWQID